MCDFPCALLIWILFCSAHLSVISIILFRCFRLKNLIRISSADPFPHMGGWVELVEIELPADGLQQIIKIEPARGRYFRLEIFSTHGSSPTEVSISNFSVYDTMEKK